MTKDVWTATLNRRYLNYISLLSKLSSVIRSNRNLDIKVNTRLFKEKTVTIRNNELRDRIMCMVQGELQTGIYLNPLVMRDGPSP